MPLSRPLPPPVLAFAGSDPSGGAGLQADLLTLAALGCHPLSVVTAITVQDTAGVVGVHVVDARWVARQARALLADVRVRAFKVGMVGGAENAAVIAEVVTEHPALPLVLDPVLASGRGDTLASPEVVTALLERLVAHATVLTPNSVEARRLAARAGEAPDLPLDVCAARLVARGARFVLVTGTHEPTREVVNVLYGARGVVRTDRWPRLPGSYHGSGCTLASAIAAGLALGAAVPDAVRDAQAYTWRTLERAYRPGA
ncbi:MAG: bifunctional hydroxymethylpyrimidine kinase/phosphomethylpyrimidine kinase, partial [Burkholderiales bacterium]